MEAIHRSAPDPEAISKSTGTITALLVTIAFVSLARGVIVFARIRFNQDVACVLATPIRVVTFVEARTTVGPVICHVGVRAVASRRAVKAWAVGVVAVAIRLVGCCHWVNAHITLPSRAC